MSQKDNVLYRIKFKDKDGDERVFILINELLQFIVTEEQTTKEGKGKGEVKQIDSAYFPSIGGALHNLANRIGKAKAKDLKDYFDAVKETQNDFLAIMKKAGLGDKP